MKKENYDDIKAMFDSDDVQLPKELFRENMVGKIKEAQSNQPDEKRAIKPKRKLAGVLSAAAVFAVIAVAALAVSGSLQKTDVSPKPVTTQTSETKAASQTADKKLIRFGSETEIENYILEHVETDDEVIYEYYGAPAADYSTGSYSAPPMPGASAEAEINTYEIQSFDSKAGTGDYSQTNTQVQGVDEADVIKNDGRYLYLAGKQEKLSIIDTQTMTAVYSGKIPAVGDGINPEYSEMFLFSDKLILVGSQEKKDAYSYDGYMWEYSCCYSFANTDTVVTVYDITDKASPKILHSFVQDGTLVSTRLTGGCVYVVTNYTISTASEQEVKDTAIPTVGGERISCDCVYINNESDDYCSYVVVSGFDASADAPTVNKACVLGGGSEVYCSLDTLYVFGENYEADSDMTDIFAFTLQNGKASYKGSASVPGTVDSQYSIDEYDGYLRIATTDYNYKKNIDISSVYVLDSNLNIVGNLKDIAPDEQVKSARFMGNTAYIVTFRNTDPLFAIDLSDPENPKILGEVKLPGFAEYLHPVGDGLLLGVGYDGDETDADYQSVKLTLFDISDPKAPVVKDSLVIKNAYSKVMYNPKTFIFNSSDGSFFIPIQSEETVYEGQWNENIAVTYQYRHFTVENGKIKGLAVYTRPATENSAFFFTGAYIGEFFYSVTDESIYEYALESGERLRYVEY